MEFISTDTIRLGYVPEKFRSQRIPIAQVYTYQKEDLTVFSQVIDLPRYQIHFHIFDAENDVMVRPDPHGEILALHYMLHGNIDCVLRQGPQVSLVQGEYNMFVVPGRRHFARLKEGVYECFHVNMKPEIKDHLDKLLLFDFFRRNLSSFGGMINFRPFRISADENLLITRILSCEKTGDEGAELLDVLASELLMAFAERYTSAMNAIFSKIKISSKHLANIYSMKAHYSKNLSNTHDVGAIALLYKMSPSEVENGFEEVFGYSFSVYFEKQRLARAFALLSFDRYSLEAIAIMMGYDKVGELDASFEDFFGRNMEAMRNLLRKWAR